MVYLKELNNTSNMDRFLFRNKCEISRKSLIVGVTLSMLELSNTRQQLRVITSTIIRNKTSHKD